MRPALLLLAGDLDGGVPGITEDPDEADALLDAGLALARATGGVGRVLLFHPPEAEAAMTARALGFRLWPADGEHAGTRWANAFRQAGELGYEGAIVVCLGAADLAAARLDEVVELLASNPAVLIPDDVGGVVVFGLQRHEPALVPATADVPDATILQRRARQLRIPLLELEAHQALTSDAVAGYLAGRG
ncbi:MAG: DUF2064 domain-containing protein [Acidimicrobiales bacterium]